MEKQARTPLQDVLLEAITRSERTRDHFDNLLRKKLDTTGKPLWDIERGKVKKPSPRVLRAIEEVLSFPPDCLVDLVHPRDESKAPRLPTALSPDQQPTTSADAGETVNITQLDLSLSMGPGTIIDQWVESEPVTFDLAFIRRITRSPPGRLRLVTGIGRSMEPTLQDGDTVLIDTMDTMLARQDGIYWVSVYGASGIKRLRAIGTDTVLVISDNKDVAPQEVAKTDLRIEGRAIWAARGL